MPDSPLKSVKYDIIIMALLCCGIIEIPVQDQRFPNFFSSRPKRKSLRHKQPKT